MSSVLEPIFEGANSGARGVATPITVAPGDGIGPEITEAVLQILQAAGAQIAPEFVEVGERVYRSGNTSGIPEEAWASIDRTGVLLKGPITTPQGGGYKSLNVTMRKTLGLYANVRPCRSWKPVVSSRHPDMDVVIIRENEEDLYAGIEHRQTQDVAQCLKLITRKGSERIIRYAFEYARTQNRQRVTCMVKDNIMKITDGLFHRVFEEVAAEYPQIETNVQIIDFGMANFVHRPESYDVIVLPNLYGDILSDVAAQMTGSVGMGGSINIGNGGALFEAIHGSAPDLARNVANPSGLLLAGVEMLRHIGQHAVAARVMNAWLATLEDGVHTVDIASEQTLQKVGTREFAAAVIARLGRVPECFTAAEATAAAEPMRLPHTHETVVEAAEKKLVGVDVFVDWRQGSTEQLAAALQAATPANGLKLVMITNRGVKVWPQGNPKTLCTDHWRCRFQGEDVSHTQVVALLGAVAAAGLDFIKTEHLYTFDGQAGYSLGQGQ